MAHGAKLVLAMAKLNPNLGIYFAMAPRGNLLAGAISAQFGSSPCGLFYSPHLTSLPSPHSHTDNTSTTPSTTHESASNDDDDHWPSPVRAHHCAAHIVAGAVVLVHAQNTQHTKSSPIPPRSRALGYTKAEEGNREQWTYRSPRRARRQRADEGDHHEQGQR